MLPAHLPLAPVAAAAAGMRVTRQQLHRVISGQSTITPDMALRLEAALGGEADFWCACRPPMTWLNPASAR
jgi:addiction module HigA family antidote